MVFDMRIAIVLIFITSLCGCAEHAKTFFVPAGFVVPQGLETENFRLRVLTQNDAASDFEAVMESKERLRHVFGGEWPPDDFSVEKNRAELGEHERAFRDRNAFTYSVVSVDGQTTLGCVYIYPCDDADAEVMFWVRDTMRQSIEGPLARGLRIWLAQDWPFEKVNYIGDH